MVERYQDKAEHQRQYSGKTADQQVRHRLVNDQDVEVAVEQRSVVVVMEERVEREDGPQRNLRHHAGVKASCEQVHQVNAQGVQQDQPTTAV